MIKDNKRGKDVKSILRTKDLGKGNRHKNKDIKSNYLINLFRIRRNIAPTYTNSYMHVYIRKEKKSNEEKK